MTDLPGFPANSDYFRRRESEERRLAALSADCSARRAHAAMAERYAALVREEVPIIKPAAA